MIRRTSGRRRARITIVVAGTVGAVALAVSALGSAPTVGAQEPPPSTTTPPPPTTVVLEDGDIGVVPPGADPADGEEPAAPETTGPDGADPAVEEAPVVILPDPTPGLNAALASIDVTNAERALEAALPGLTAARVRTARASAERTDAVRARRDRLDEAVAARRLIEAMAVNALMHGDVAGLEPLLGFPDLARLRDLHLGDATAAHLQIRYDEAILEYRRSIGVEASATAALTQALVDQRGADAVVAERRLALDQAILAASRARRELGPGILGTAALDTADLVAWYRRYYRADPPMAPIAVLIDTYLLVGAEEGVAGDIAFAQAVLETGGFRSGHARGFNFAGIGAYDSCAPTCAFRFRSVQDGVRAHIHLLRAYADPGLTSAQLATEPDTRVAPERVGVRGCCPRWTSLTGVWATDPNYDRKVLGIYRLMVETARQLDRQQL